MKNIVVSLVVMTCVGLLYATARGQLLTDEFDYLAGANLTSNGWEAHSSAGTNPIKVSSGGLSYPGYASSGIGNAASLSGEGEDVNRTFTGQNSGTIYVSFLVNFSNATTATGGEYFLHLNTSTHLGRVYVRKSGSSLAFGLAKSTENATFTGFNYPLNTTYLVTLKYTFVSGTSNDEVSLFVESSGVPSSEPGTPTIGPLAPTTPDPSSISAIALRQGGSSTMVLMVDGIRVGTSWSDAPLPVQLLSFTARAAQLTTYLRWSTATETNNYGFETERREIRQIFTDSHRSGSRNDARYQTDRNQSQHLASGWTTIGFVAGAGTSTTPREYIFTDHLATPGRYAYRIKQIDSDGTFEYFYAAEVEVGLAERQFNLFEPYPHPFNPSTTIDFTLPDDGPAKLKLYDLLGREIQTLFDQEAMGGRLYRVHFDAKALPSGLYILQLQAGGEMRTRKLLLTK